MGYRKRRSGWQVAVGCAVFVFSAVASVLHAIEISPVISARLYGGQYFFQSEESSLSGNIGVTASPAIAFNKLWTLIPTVSSAWRGTKSVRDLVGGGTILQQTQEHSGNLKGVFSPNKFWQFKGGGGYKWTLLKETKDESWGKGLFDSLKPSVNFEVERFVGLMGYAAEDASVRLGYDIYWLDFKNFSSLESQNKDLGRENASAKTLNTLNHGPYLSARTAFPFLGGQKARFEGAYYFTFRNYDEQKIVVLSGDLSADPRRDKSHILMSNFTFPFVFTDSFKLLAELKGNLSVNISNQNNYDARLTRFNPNFYAYREYSLGPNFNFLLGGAPWIVNAGFNYVRKNYGDRPIQDGAGTYGAEKIGTNEYYANFGATYPINKNFRAQALLNFGWSRSNMKYEKTYRYNYETFTYLMGVVYEY